MKELYMTKQGEKSPRILLNKVILNRNQSDFIETHSVEDARLINPMELYTVHPLELTVMIDRGHQGDNTITVSIEDSGLITSS